MKKKFRFTLDIAVELEDIENFYQQVEHVEFAQAGFMEIK